MKLKRVIKKLEDVAEQYRSLYAEKDGEFHLAVSVDGEEPVDELKAALDKERKAARDLEKLKKQFEALGKSPEEIAELIAAASKADEDKATKAGEWDKLKQQMNDRHAAELSKKDAREKALLSNIDSMMVDAVAATAIAGEKGEAQLLLPHVRGRTKVIEEDGKFHVRVVDANGNPRVNGKGEFLSIKDLVTEMKGDPIFGRAFEASGTGGGGAGPNGGGSGANAKNARDMTPKEKAEFIGTHGSAKWNEKVASDYSKPPEKA